MTVTIDSRLDHRLLEKAAAEGMTVPAYVERLVEADESGERELESLALEGLNSGEPIEVGPGYWEEKHRRLDERIAKTVTQ
jgi:hypothetical protein